LAAAVSALVAGTAWLAGTLTRAGALAAWSVGVLILLGTGWRGGAVLAVFFLAGNLISHVGLPRPPNLDAKGERRDLWQVYANGGVAAAAALIGLRQPELGLWLVTGTLAAAAADTWATSTGMWSSVEPRRLWFGPAVPRGTSGGATVFGTVGAAAGALIVAGSGALVSGMPLLLPVGTLIGFSGMVADSVLGALLQGSFHCPRCSEASEWPRHRCGASTIRKGGFAWLNNDGVNFLATIFACCCTIAIWAWLSPAH
jgi:uncharacterized protein (TIGR00297 family)